MSTPRLLHAALLCLLFVACDGDPGPPPPAAVVPAAPAPGVLRLAGTGALAPLMTQLAAAFARLPRPNPLRVVIEESIGSGGGIRAAFDGVVDLGLISRPLHADEQRLGLVHIPIGWDAVVIAAHPRAPVTTLSAAQLYDLYMGRCRSFPDGSPAVMLLRDRGESANLALEQVVPQLRDAREQAYQAHRLRVLYHDSAMAEALVATPGALGVMSLGAVQTDRLPLTVLGLGVARARPSVAALRDGTWPIRRPLGLVLRRDRLERARPLLDYLASQEAAVLAEAGGYWLVMDRGRAP